MQTTKESPDWRQHMNEQERDELVRAQQLRELSADQFRELKRRIKDRCVKRMRRGKK